jgi:hypothetical protein
MVDSVAGSVVGTQLQNVRNSVAALKVDKEVSEASVRAITENATPEREPPPSGRGRVVDIKA